MTTCVFITSIAHDVASLLHVQLDAQTDETFISQAFSVAGVPCISVKRIINRMTGLVPYFRITIQVL